MSLLPLLVDDSLLFPRYRNHQPTLEEYLMPRQNLLEDILEPLAIATNLLQSPEYRQARTLRQCKQQQGASSVTLDKNKFQANFDVQHFKPNEITVKVADNTVTVEAKHEEKQDEHGHIYRHFVRKYVLPKTCDVSRLESKLSTDGVLTISAPSLEQQPAERSIPISQTGTPARSVEEKKQQEEVKTKSKI